jgi:hypothetical protein
VPSPDFAIAAHSQAGGSATVLLAEKSSKLSWFPGPAATQPADYFKSKKCCILSFALTEVQRYKLRGC